MKLYFVLEKQFKKLFFLGILVFFISCIFVFSVSAQTVEDLNNKINQRNSDISKLEQEIKAYQAELDDLGKQKNSLSGSIKELDLTKKKLIANINITQNKIDKTNLKIQSLSSEINNKEDSITNGVNAIILGLRATNEFDQGNVLGTLLSENDFSLMWNDIDNIATVHDKLRSQMSFLRQIKGDLEDTRQETLDAKKELLALKSELADQKKIVEQNANEKKRLLAQTKNNESNYQKLLKSRLAQKDALEKELRDYESQLVYVLDPSKLPSGGVFSWPLDYVYITQLFGKTVDAKRLYASGSHGGVDFRAAVGTPVKAMANGVIAGVGNTDVQCPNSSFGKFVFIKYDNGLASAYGHLSLTKVQIGESVVRGQIVGYSGNTGYSTGPHLHVAVYASNAAEVKSIPSKSCPGKILTQPIAPINAYLDPMYYFPPYNK